MDLNSFSGYIFDLDGTLIDSSFAWSRVDDVFLQTRGIKTPPDYDKAIAGMGFDLAARYTIDRFCLDETVEEITKEWFDIVRGVYATEVKLFNGVREYLEALKKSGKKLAVATVNAPELTESVLKSNGVFSLFDAVVTIDEVSRPKGFPDIYLKAAEKIGVSADGCVVFEDIIEGIKGARDGGFKSVAVLCKKNIHNKDELMALSDKYIYSYGELL